jgi:2-hydroxy-3-oxopropionate reductase
LKLGFIGLGVMGRAMAGHLLRAGHELAIWARRPEATAPLVAAGARSVASPRELAACSDVVFTMVTGTADVEGLVFAADGLAAGALPGRVIIDCSTIAPTAARDIGARLAARGVGFLDAPVSGGGLGAAQATLAIMVGGEAAVLGRVRPLFDLLGRTIIHVGANGAGQVAKACNQMVMVAAIEACAEAARLAAAHQVDFGRVREAMAGGSAASRVLDFFGGKMAARDFAAGVEARLHHKDFGVLLAEVPGAGAAVPITAQVAQQLNALMALGWGNMDTSNLLRVLEQVESPRG